VVIPAYNRAALVGRAIESALAQRRRPEQIIVVDDGSTDDTAAVAGAFGADVDVVRQDHAGVGAARNAGVARARTDLVAFLDSDDFWFEDHLARIDAAVSATDGGAALYFSDMLLPRDLGGGSHWAKCAFAPDAPHDLRLDGRGWVLMAFQPMLVPASVVRRDVYLALGGTDTRLVRRGDTHLFFRIGLSQPVCSVSGLAGSVTDDDPRSLTRALDPSQDVFWACSVSMYSDLLRGWCGVDEPGRRELELRLADAHWGLARALGSHDPLRSLYHYAHAARLDTGILAAKLRRLGGRVRPSPSDTPGGELGA
jgi:glycosyltransferase involved in cell wall biosynthesis